jgi:mono/diheme cytochrome c family protein
VFNLRCASCHGERGNAPGAPAVMGPGTLRGFADTASLCEYIASSMPPGHERLDARDARDTCDYVARVGRLAPTGRDR